MSSLSSDVERRLLEAALVLFARHGFQRTSMADIARVAQVARTTLYLRFSDKRALFTALAAMLASDALTRAEGAWRDGAALADNLEATILAKDLTFFRLMTATPHGAEMLDVDAELTRAHAARLDAGFAALLVRRGAEAVDRGVELDAFDGPEGFGSFLSITSAGLKHETRNEEDYRQAVRRLARVAGRAARVQREGETQ